MVIIDGRQANDVSTFPTAAKRVIRRNLGPTPRGIRPLLESLDKAALAYREAAEDLAAVLAVEGVPNVEGISLVEVPVSVKRRKRSA